MGNLIEHGNVLLEVIDHLVLRARSQVLFAVECECSEGSRE